MRAGLNISGKTTDRKARFLLVVDSNADDLFFISRLLQRFGYKAYTAASAREADSIIATVLPAFMIVASVLQDMNGIEFVRRIKECDDTMRIPCIALKRRNEILEDAAFLQQASIKVLEKPIAPEELYRTIQAALERTPRSYIRIPTFLPVQATGQPLDCLENACTTDLSEQGMFVRTRNPALHHTRLSCQVHIYGQIIKVEAAVLYRRTEAAPGQGHIDPGMGMEFIRIASEDRNLIRRYIKQEITRGIMPHHA